MNWLDSWWLGFARYKGHARELAPREHVDYRGFDWQRVRRDIGRLYGVLK